MAWTKYFKPVNSVLPKQPGGSGAPADHSAVSKFNTWLPEVYQGPPNRMQRYVHYEQMDMDHEINTALDTIAEFSTQVDDVSDTVFSLEYNETPSETETQILNRSLKEWVKTNNFNKRMFKIFRSTIMYGDQFFIRDPETMKLIWIDPTTVEKIIVNEAEGKKPETYFMKDLDLNLQELSGSNVNSKTQLGYNAASNVFPSAPFTGQANYTNASAPHMYGQGSSGSQVSGQGSGFPVDAQNVVHVSLTEGMDNSWPFGVSVLENIFKIYKQKELLEDAVLIYRIHRAPERRMFFIDVGNMPPNKAQQYLERVRYEVQQKRIPSRTGGGENVMDSAYNPMCLSLDTKIPLMDGRVLDLYDIIAEFEQGKDLQVYSYHKGKATAANIEFAGITRREAEVLRVVLENDKSVVATPDHRFILQDGSCKEAQELRHGDVLKSFADGGLTVRTVQKIKDRMDTADITVDTDSHWFGLDAGVYVHNSMLEDFFFAQTADGRGSRVEILPGGENLGTIDDLRFFNNKMIRGLGVPSSYLPTGPEDGSATYNDGQVGTSFIQEYRFYRRCKRFQNQMIETFDREFKLYLKKKGINIDSSSFSLRFAEPKNFSSYKQIELDNARVALFNNISDVPYISKRFALKKYLGLSEDEIIENEKMWKEENPGMDPDTSGAGSQQAGLKDVGVTPGGFDTDFENEMEGEEPEGEEDEDVGPGAEEDLGEPGEGEEDL